MVGNLFIVSSSLFFQCGNSLINCSSPCLYEQGTFTHNILDKILKVCYCFMSATRADTNLTSALLHKRALQIGETNERSDRLHHRDGGRDRPSFSPRHRTHHPHDPGLFELHEAEVPQLQQPLHNEAGAQIHVFQQLERSAPHRRDHPLLPLRERRRQSSLINQPVLGSTVKKLPSLPKPSSPMW